MGTSKKKQKKKPCPVRSKRSKTARRKGHQFERDVANKFKKLYPFAKRHLEMQKAEALGFDIDNTGPFKIQCKAYKDYVPISRIKEAPNGKNDIPLLITKGDNKPAVACMYLDDLLSILEDIGVAYEGEEENEFWR